jgi:hypothetical protein
MIKECRNENTKQVNGEFCRVKKGFCLLDYIYAAFVLFS